MLKSQQGINWHLLDQNAENKLVFAQVVFEICSELTKYCKIIMMNFLKNLKENEYYYSIINIKFQADYLAQSNIDIKENRKKDRNANYCIYSIIYKYLF